MPKCPDIKVGDASKGIPRILVTFTSLETSQSVSIQGKIVPSRMRKKWPKINTKINGKVIAECTPLTYNRKSSRLAKEFQYL